MTTRTDYQDLQSRLAVIERETGFYLADENVDHENVTEGTDLTVDSPSYWAQMLSAATMAAAMRLENEGLDRRAVARHLATLSR